MLRAPHGLKPILQLILDPDTDTDPDPDWNPCLLSSAFCLLSYGMYWSRNRALCWSEAFRVSRDRS
jgi:hypothetical protein